MALFGLGKNHRAEERKNYLDSKILSLVNKSLFDVSPQAVLVVDRRGVIVNLNQKVQEWLGYRPSEIIGKKFYKLPFINRESIKNLLAAFAKRKLGREIKPYIIECITKDNKTFFGTLSASPIKNEEDKFIAEIVVISDVTESQIVKGKQAKMVHDLTCLSRAAVGFVELSINDNIYHYIATSLKNLVGDCIVLFNSYDEEKNIMIIQEVEGLGAKFNSTMKILNVRRKKTKFVLEKYAKNNLIRRKLIPMKGGIYELGQGKVSKMAARIAEKIFTAGDMYIMGFSWKGKLYGNATVVLRRNETIREESIEAFLYQASVALQRRDSEIALKKAHDELEIKVEERTADLEQATKDLEKFKLAVEDAYDQMLITDPKGIILYANKASEKITGFKKSQMIGKETNLWSQTNATNKELWKTIQDKKEIYLGESKNKRFDKTEYISELHIAPVFDQQREVMFYVWIERDITKAKEIDQAKSEFVSLASHQLRTPLSAINWYTEMLLEDKSGEVSDDQKKYLKEIYSASKRMGDLVNSLLNVSRIELGTFIVEPEQIDLCNISGSVIDELNPKIIEKKLKIAEDYQPKKIVVSADPKLMRIIFQNLISNAVKYSHEKSEIKVSVNQSKSDKSIEIQVRDDGLGIPANQKDQIFTKLFRADNVRDKVSEGTGLGLYIVKKILDHTGGKIWFISEESKGATFFVKIPQSGMLEKKGTRKLT